MQKSPKRREFSRRMFVYNQSTMQLLKLLSWLTSCELTSARHFSTCTTRYHFPSLIKALHISTIYTFVYIKYIYIYTSIYINTYIIYYYTAVYIFVVFNVWKKIGISFMSYNYYSIYYILYIWIYIRYIRYRYCTPEKCIIPSIARRVVFFGTSLVQ